MNPLEKIGHGIEAGAEAVLHGIEYPIEFLVKAEKVLADAIREQPQVKASVIDLVKQAEAVIADVAVAAAGKGVNLSADAKALADAEGFFTWFRDQFIPVISTLYHEIETDVK